MIITAELENSRIIVKKPKDIGRLYNKSNMGKSIPGDKLELNLIESVFLLDEEKIKIFHNKKEVDFETLVKIASKNIKDFEIKYLVFKDLRKRGQMVNICKKDSMFDLYQCNKKRDEKRFFVCVFSERDFFEIDKTHILLEDISDNSFLWIAIVDDEGDITYYKVSHTDLKGKIKPSTFGKIKGFILDDRVIVFDKKKSKDLFEKEFFGKPFGSGLQISFIEILYLFEKKIISLVDKDEKKVSKSEFLKNAKINQPDILYHFKVYKDLKKKGLVIKTGFKFGTHFRVYTDHPDEIHAEYLVHVVEKKFKSVWAEFSRAVRLAHSVNKEIVFSRILADGVEYICFGRLRP